MVQIPLNELNEMVRASVDAAMKKNDIPDTLENRIDTLMGMHRLISLNGIHEQNDAAILREIEDEVLRLQIEAL